MHPQTKYPEVFSVLNNTSRGKRASLSLLLLTLLMAKPMTGYIKSEEIFPDEIRPDQKIKEVRAWLKSQGVLDLEPVTLFAEQLEKVGSMILLDMAYHSHMLPQLVNRRSAREDCG